MDTPPLASSSSPPRGAHHGVGLNGDHVPQPSTSTSTPTTLDLAPLRLYLNQLVPLILGAQPSELESMYRDPLFESIVTKWANEPSQGSVYVVKSRIEPDEDVVEHSRDDSDAPTYSFLLAPVLSYSNSQAATLALIKHSSTLDMNLPLSTQLHCLNLFGPAASTSSSSNASALAPASEASATNVGSTVYEGLHRLVHYGVAPAFEAFVESKAIKEKQLELASGRSRRRQDDNKENDSKLGIPMTKKKFAELELSLLHLQQNVEIPDIVLSIHPTISAAIASAQAAGVRPSVDLIDASILEDSTFLNKLQSEVNSWIKEIQNVTKLSRDVASGTASQEINFWLAMEKALESIEEQLRSDPIVLTLDILKTAKRFHATVSFMSDTGLRGATEIVTKYNQLMKDFPLNELLAATDLAKVQDSLHLIFGHINKKLKLSPYPIRRALPLVEAISQDLNDQLLKVLGSQRLAYLDYAAFERSMSACSAVFHAWDEGLKEFTTVARDVTRKRNEKFIPIKINARHAALQERVGYFRQFRKQHHQLQVMVGPLGTEVGGAKRITTGATVAAEGGQERHASVLNDVDMDAEVKLAYENVKNVDVLDVSSEGTEIWVTAETSYNERVARVENQIIARLRDRLASARNANEMFRVFSKFNALFVRPKIRGAIAEYQSELIDSVKEDIRALHDKFKRSYAQSEAYHMSQLRDHPPVSGAIVWAKQIERQLLAYMKRVEDVLGKGWELYAEGTKLQAESQSFRRRLDTRPIYDAWLHDIQRRNLQITGRLFDITKSRAQGGQLQLVVNFDAQIITLFKEVRNLVWLGFSVPHTISNIAKDAKRVYPHAVSLMETLRTYSQTIAKLQANPGIAALVAEFRTNAQQQITKGMNVRWEHVVNSFDSRHALSTYLPGSTSTTSTSNEVAIGGGKHGVYVREFASVVSAFQDRTDALIDMYAELTRTIDNLATCAYDPASFAGLLESVQKTIDQLNLEGYANLDAWVAGLDTKIEAILLTRLRAVIDRWCVEFRREVDQGQSGGERVAPRKRVATSTGGVAKDGTAAATTGGAPAVEGDGLQLESVVHEIRIQNQVIYLDPPIERARQSWYSQLHRWLGVVCGLKRIQSSRYEIGLKLRSSAAQQHANYMGLLNQLTDGTLEKPFALVEDKLQEISQYVNKWLQFQSLWDLESEFVFARLGDSLASWQQLLLEIRKTRGTFDNSETQRSFGVAVIDYEQVQSKVNAKYDTWQRDILGRFGSKLGSTIKETHAAIQKARHDLEHHSIEGSSTAATVSFITYVQDVKRKVKQWGPMVEIFTQGQKTLERQRYQFPNDWLHVDQIEGEWSSFNDILARKNASIKDQLAGLQLKIVAQDQILHNRVNEIVVDWEANKPIQGSLKADAAMTAINTFETRVERLKDELDEVARAKEALDLDLVKDDRLEPVREEIRDLKAVWTALSGVWAQIAEVRETLWTSVQARKLRQLLDGLLATTRDMPSRMRQYAAFEYVQEALRALLKPNALIGDLKSEALRERHWRQLFKSLRVGATYSSSSMTLGTVWDLDLRRNEAVIKEVIVQAQGEMALEEFLKQVKETWTNYTLDLVNYQNKTRLIRGWDDLFTKCGENLNSLTAMKLSPYFKVFEEDASSWEDRLNRIHVLFDVWIDVQRQWVYLEGIFTGSADIKHLLPIESQRFNNINAEFLTVMKKVFKSPFVLDVLNIQGVQKSLERLADLLSKIQKALGEYLERERSSFPRFYFVGDEDLLEIIGNSKDIVRIGKFLKKMFAGLSSIKLDEDITRIEGMASREGEEVMFSTPIVFAQHPKINDWLTRLESEMKVSLAKLLARAYADLEAFYVAASGLDAANFLAWIDRYPAQLVVVAVQIAWTRLVESAIEGRKSLSDGPLAITLRGLDVLADTVLTELAPIQRRKCEHLITELVHERDVLRLLAAKGVSSTKDFEWLYHMRFYLDVSRENPLEQLSVQMASATFPYGFEYLGVPDRLVQTPLTDRCYLTLTQALDSRLGGSPFGPAGTGKTESVKALGVALGRFVLVFCCDETFDFQAMGRIFVGLCQVGAWGCFDEFNRLEERILSAVSQQIQSIQLGLSAGLTDPNAEVELVGRHVKLSQDTGIFITMNPGYAGRSNLPDNLKKLFRSIAMTRPDRELIAQVMLFSQGFRTAETLASKVVPFFNLCAEQLSSQPHYDFGLRALKAVLVSAGHLKRERLQAAAAAAAGGEDTTTTFAGVDIQEQEILIQSVTETIVPKLIADDVPLLTGLLADVFPGIDYVPVNLDKLKEHVLAVCAERHFVADEAWLQKVIQLYQIQNIQHGLMMVGPSATGKTSAWRVLQAALERLTGVEGVSYVIDPKAISKEALYGTLDSTTREWNDGLFTHILRKIVDDVRAESTKRHWIVFDGDVDPEWVENLNSVLDDNKLLTLPNGERLNLPPNVRIMFEVESLKYATLATVSRCGMVWFSEDAVTPSMLYRNYLNSIRAVAIDSVEDDAAVSRPSARTSGEDSSEVSSNLANQRLMADKLEPLFLDSDGLVPKALAFASRMDHIMDFTSIRAITTLFSLLNKTIRNVVEYNVQHSDFPLSPEQVESYMMKRFLLALVWSFTGDSKLDTRAALGDFLRENSGLDFPPVGPGSSLIDFDVHVGSGDWTSWQNAVPTIEIETHAVLSADVVIPTIDTARHEEVLYSWLSEHRPLMLCGPPGSGKTMTLFSALRKLPDLEVIGLNFSSATTPELILKTFEQRCEYRKTPNGIILAPAQIGRWIVLFCDEINLPTTDKYGTQKVISFMRQLVEQGGYYRTLDKAWVKLERIQFVGACNPPTDPGRVPLSHRFLRHAPLVMVDYPGETSLKQIYGTFARALLKVVPTLRAYAEPLTAAMVDFYLASQRRFTSDTQAHYVYSPRELTRWTRGIYEALRPLDSLPVEGLVRVWAHEALRLFQDRLVTEEERRWTDETIDTLALKHFPTINREEALARPILYSNWLSKHYVPVDREQLREYTKARLRVFYEEELDVPLVLFNDVLDHVLRIDRVFRQVQGHLLLIGVSGSGKTTLSRFVAWMNGLSVFQIKVHNKYSAEDFDDDLRSVLRRSGCKGEKIAFIMDESNVLDSGFLERMNTLLANAEIPGLFEGDEHAALMTACKEGAQRDGLMLDSPEELYRWFTTQVARNLHVVFTMNPPADGLASRAATSPALFNRCVLDWFGDWSDQAFFQVGMEFTNTLDLDTPSYAPPAAFPVAYRQLSLPPVHRSAIINALVYVHASMYETNRRLSRRQGRTNHVTPRHYLDFINQYVRIFNEKRDELEEQQRHLNVGLDKLRTTVVQVEELRKSLAIKRGQLEAKNAEANDKLKRMVADQQDAEQKKVASIEMQAALERQKKEIAERKSLVMGELADAEPAVEEAQSAVSNIKKQQLTEVRSMANPPEAVKLAMESVCTILGFQIDSWKTVQSIIRRDDFIASIVNFDTASSMTRQLREKMRREYLSRPTFNFETVNRASKACGPLCKWVIAQVNYSDILDKVGPLRDEVMALENRAETTKHQASAIITMIAELEARIASYKDEYALLISETQMIKTEMERVQQRVDRSITLLDSLGSEKTRWEAGSKTFEVQMSTVAGDVLLSAAFLAYAGYFDQHYRESMWSGWTSHLAEAGIEFKPELSLSEYLSTADDRLSWRAKSLPDDDLCTENAIMLKRFDRYPLIIDPSGQATNFLLNEYKDRKISVTSFLDEAFLKNLESALRFGTPLLIQDVEHLDPILNAVLNKELRRAGGRVLIRLGNQDIDFSPAFTLFLSTRDPSTEFPADLNSRVTMVNFSITRASLQAQSLNQVLRVERPETDRKRSDLLRLQGEFRARLHHLEKSLLSALNESQGNILDDDKVIETLETLKREAADVTRKVEETDAIMAEVEQVTSEYLPLAQASSSIFFILDELNLLHHFYQFSLRFYLDIFDYVLLRNPSLKGVTDPQQRLSILIGDLFLHVFKRTSRALIHSDHVVLAVLLAQVKLRNSNIAFDEYEFSFLLEGGEGAPHGSAPEARSSLLDSTQQRRLRSFGRLASFKDVREHIEANEDEWKAFFASSSPETVVPAIWPDVSRESYSAAVGVVRSSVTDSAYTRRSALVLSLRRILIVKCLRPERLLPAFGAFVNVVFERDMFVEATYSLENMVSTEVDAASPVCLCSVPGYDASYRVDNLVATTKSKCVSVAMGSQEGFALADQAIAAAARTGHWVLLKNVHLAPSWLSQLEKRLQSLNPNKAFRLFLTMETNPAIPVNILRQGRVLMNEPPPGIRANILESLKSISPARLSSGPAEKTRLYFLLAWFHAVVQERLRYAPLGWSKVYEFNDSDQDAALGMIDSWLSATAKGRANVDPALIPWDAIRSLMRESVYGGKIDTEFDQILLNSFVSFFFSPRAYDVNFELVPSGPSEAGLVMPDATRLDQFVSWASGLPEQEPPSYLSLPPSAEKVIAVAQGKAILARLLKMRSLDDDDETVAVDVKKTASSVSQPAWMRALRDSCAEWLELLPKTSVALANRNVDSFHDPLARFFDRECAVGRTLLAKIRNDLTMVIRVCDGELKQTNDIRSLMQDLTKGSVPSPWRRYRCRDLAAGAWIADFAQRLAQLTRIVESRGQLGSAPTSLGLLFHPHGFVTASRQAIAHATHTSLEQLSLQLDLEETGAPGAYIVEGLALIGAEWTSSRLVLNDGSTTRLAPSQIRWTKADDASAVPKRGRKVVGIPCWLDSSRSDALFTVQLDAGSTDPSALSQRGVCIVAALY
ncbi:BQ2448_4154 [Microbotryum intermedium]|uniref:Dynein heavy chain, cytoplasmic n=1 Tax=Microbotryum intermedium TaxID=269621 RepID=A0A238FHA7_9BASI|nr:BQ2448_4154 [Microbotryum intermedium]